MPLLDGRPPAVDARFRPGNTFTVTFNWPAGALTGRTFTADLDATSLTVNIIGDDLVVSMSEAQTTAAAAVGEFVLTETTGGGSDVVIVGSWHSSNGPSAGEATVVSVNESSGVVTVTAQGLSTTVGDLTVAGDFYAEAPLIFWVNLVAQTIPNATWTPLIYNGLNNHVGTWTSYVPASTTIAAGSNGAVLPQGTINVASTAAFASAGWLAVTISGTMRVIRYTGKNATQFTGCTLGVGTLATGQTIAQANVQWDVPAGMMGPATAEVAWASNGTGLRGIRFRDASVFGFSLATTVVGAVVATDPLMHVQSTEQPAAGSGYWIEVYQSSGGTLDTAPVSLASPRLVAMAASGIA